MVEKMGGESKPIDDIHLSGILTIKVSPLLKACIDSTLLYFVHKVPHVKDIMAFKFEEVLFNLYYSCLNN